MVSPHFMSSSSITITDKIVQTNITGVQITIGSVSGVHAKFHENPSSHTIFVTRAHADITGEVVGLGKIE
jgi:hypothetical protein